MESPLFNGGRKEGLRLLEREFDYSKRDYPSENGNSHLSPHLKFGTVSMREAYYKKLENEDFIRELYWRDFYTLLAYYNPHVFGNCYRREFDYLEWENNSEYFNAWKEGKTGYRSPDGGSF